LSGIPVKQSQRGADRREPGLLHPPTEAALTRAPLGV
jgi:hypothetical protein